MGKLVRLKAPLFSSPADTYLVKFHEALAKAVDFLAVDCSISWSARGLEDGGLGATLRGDEWEKPYNSIR